MPVLLTRLLAMLTRRRLDRDLDDEIRTHIELIAAEYERRGLSRDDAYSAARRAFGGVEPMKETYRDRRGLPWLVDLQQDARYALRGFVRSPGFTIVALAVVALGIGANTAIFSLLDAVLLRPLPVRQPNELVIASVDVDGRRNMPFAAYHVRAFGERRDVLAALAAFRPLPVSLTDRGQSELGFGQLVSANYHDVLGVEAALGRTLHASDDADQANHSVAVISHSYWQRMFGGAPNVIGESLEINGRPFTIVGVTARGFFGTEPGRAVDVTIPLAAQPGVFGARSLINDASEARWLYAIGRLAPGVSRERANAALAVTWDQVRSSRARPGRQQPAQRFSLLEGARGMYDLRDRFSVPLRVLMAMVGVVLLVACANLATLLLVRSSARRREIGLRLALGASRGRLARQLLTESLMLSMGGGIAGVGLAYIVGDLLVQIMSRGAPQAIVLDLAPNARTLTFTLVASLAAGIVFGIVPSLRAARLGVATAARTTAGVAHTLGRWGQITIAAQVALSMVLLAEAGLFARSLSALRDVGTGFVRGENLLLANVRTRATNIDQVARQIALFKDLAARPDALGARSITFSMDAPLAGGLSYAQNIGVEGHPRDTSEAAVWFNFVGPRFFETMGISVDGRDISATDDESAPPVAVISRSLARRYFPGVNPIGRRIHTEAVDVQVVGVAADVKYNGVRDAATEMIYLPFLQGRSAEGVGLITIALRASRSAAETAAALRRELRIQAPDLLVANLVTLEERRDAMLARERITATLSIWFGALALLLGCVGLYGTLSYAVARRTSELAVRIALGAGWSRVVTQVLGESLRPVIAGIALGLPLAFGAGRFSERLLFGVRGSDPASYALAVVVLIGAAAAAASVPARRATLVDPISALRSE